MIFHFVNLKHASKRAFHFAKDHHKHLSPVKVNLQYLEKEKVTLFSQNGAQQTEQK